MWFYVFFLPVLVLCSIGHSSALGAALTGVGVVLFSALAVVGAVVYSMLLWFKWTDFTDRRQQKKHRAWRRSLGYDN